MVPSRPWPWVESIARSSRSPSLFAWVLMEDLLWRTSVPGDILRQRGGTGGWSLAESDPSRLVGGDRVVPGQAEAPGVGLGPSVGAQHADVEAAADEGGRILLAPQTRRAAQPAPSSFCRTNPSRRRRWSGLRGPRIGTSHPFDPLRKPSAPVRVLKRRGPVRAKFAERPFHALR